MKAFDPTKPVQTKDGRPARIICTDMKRSAYPIVALVNEGKEERISSFRVDGGSGIFRDSDLVNIPEEKTGWINIYKGHINTYPGDRVYSSKKEAFETIHPNIIDTVEIKWKE